MLLPLLAELNLYELWRQFCSTDYSYTATEQRRNFREYVRLRTSEPTLVSTRLKFCGDCGLPVLNSNLHEIFDRLVCPSCIALYKECSECNKQVREHTLARVRPDYRVCYECRLARYLTCPKCSVVYLSNDTDAVELHKHICCASPQLEFEVAGVPNDTPTELVIAAGEISEAGMRAIQQEITQHANTVWDGTYKGQKLYETWMEAKCNFASHTGNEWQAKNGNFTKRLSSYVYKQYELKAPPKLLTSIGNIARDHSKGATYNIELTRKLNEPAAYFAHGSSCWWDSYAESRCALKTNGGFGIRAFDENGDVNGRAWVMPLKKQDCGFAPTFDTSTPDAWAVFNGYYTLSDYTPARILAQMTGTTYRKIRFSARGMSINSGSGYLVGPEEVVAPYTNKPVEISAAQHAQIFEPQAA